MALFLIESPLPHRHSPQPLLEAVADAIEAADGEVIEAQLGSDTGLAYTIVEHADGSVLERSLADAGLAIHGVAEVRLVGPSLDELKAHRSGARYLVEWDLPAGLKLDAYLERKRSKAPGYAKVPETTFLRTYVCLDMSKCLCLYDAPDEEAVLRARAAVDTPVDRVTKLEEGRSRVRA